MPASITMQVQLFGAFRKFHAGPITLVVASGSPVSAIKTALAEALRGLNHTFDDVALITQSVLATETAVLAEDACLVQDAKLAILPPVCGG